MSAPIDAGDAPPVVARLEDFDSRSGSIVERLLFNHRGAVLLVCALVTGVLAWFALGVQLNASFEKMIPATHPYIANYLAERKELNGLGNAVRVAVENRQGTVYDAAYMETLRKISDELFLLPGVDRVFVKSLWTPATRWVGITEEGLEGGPVIPPRYRGSAADLATLRANVERSGEIGQLVARDQRSSVVYVPLLDKDPRTGQALDYGAFSRKLEDIRRRYQNDQVDLHITGFSKVAGDLIEGLQAIVGFFVAAIVVATAILYAYTRCGRSTLIVVACSLVAVVWQLGLLPLLGYELDPYSVLVPFLVFAIAMSHGAQKMNGILQDIGRGTHRVVAARFTFRRLFLAGLTALLCDAVGFAVLMIIDIQVIHDLAIIASLGVAVIIFTNLILLPNILSFVGVSPRAAARSLAIEQAPEQGWLWRTLARFTERRFALLACGVALVLAIGGFWVSLGLKIGDLDPGAPELRADSRYNRDVAFMTQHYGASSDVFAVMVKTPEGQCARYDTLMRLDALEWTLAALPGVEATHSLARLNRRMLVGLSEGSPKWYEMSNSQDMLNTITSGAPRGLYNETCNLLTLYAYLSDHKADTLARVVDAVEAFAAANNTAQVQFKLAAGSAGIEAATNIVVKQASHEMLLWVYGAVILLCLLTFRSWRAVLVAVLPLMLTSILAEALMVVLGMGVKVATLPVIALGVGIGVDYALYLLSVQLTHQRRGLGLAQSYRLALQFTGKVVALVGITLAAGVITWAWSPIKFQADMGILLTFMFVWNMLGALVLVPALSYCLLGDRQRPQAAVTPGVTLASQA